MSLPLNNTLIQGAQNLFGIKAKMQFGKLDVTVIATTQRGKTASINLGGNNNSGQGRPFEFIASNYDENRHFFLGQFFRDNYEAWVSNPPQIISGVNITHVEVYILNRNNDTQTLRNVMAFMDMAGPPGFITRKVTPTSVRANDNKANILFDRVKDCHAMRLESSMPCRVRVAFLSSG